MELNPEFSSAHSLLGRVYLAQAHPREALAEWEREAEPWRRLYGQALAYYALGRKKESDAALAELIAKYHADWAFQIAEVMPSAGNPTGRSSWETPTTTSPGSMAPVTLDLGPARSRAAAYHFHPFAGGQPPLMTILLDALSLESVHLVKTGVLNVTVS